MLNIRTRPNRSSSSILTLLNKENNFDFGNRVNLNQTKAEPKQAKQQDENIRKARFPLIKKSLLDNERQEQEVKSNRINLQNIRIEVDSRKIENYILRLNYSEQILNCLKLKDFESKPVDILGNHKVTKELRAKMIDWMIEVFSSFKCSELSFFTAVRFMDSFFCKSRTCHEISELHLTGITCIWMACKYEEIYPLKLKIIYQKVGHKKLSKEQIIKKEEDILSTLQFDLVGVNNYELLTQVVEMSDFELTNMQKTQFHKIALYLSKMALYDYQIANEYSYCQICVSCIYVALKLLEQQQSISAIEQKIKEIQILMEVKENVRIDLAAKIFSLARTFDKVYPNLKNLKKFNDYESVVKTVTNQ